MQLPRIFYAACSQCTDTADSTELNSIISFDRTLLHHRCVRPCRSSHEVPVKQSWLKLIHSSRGRRAARTDSLAGRGRRRPCIVDNRVFDLERERFLLIEKRVKAFVCRVTSSIYRSREQDFITDAQLVAIFRKLLGSQS